MGKNLVHSARQNTETSKTHDYICHTCALGFDESEDGRENCEDERVRWSGGQEGYS